jgi:hypothetical protein
MPLAIYAPLQNLAQLMTAPRANPGISQVKIRSGATIEGELSLSIRIEI